MHDFSYSNDPVHSEFHAIIRPRTLFHQKLDMAPTASYIKT
ncbi:hypothetical protein [Candidatus Erwinia haradaeae]|nr:hypothetical protein [Candidatus Erwinia haradaeae]